MVPAKPLALGGTGHIDQGALREQLSGQLLTRLELFGVIGADLSEVTTRGDASLGEVAGKRLSHLGPGQPGRSQAEQPCSRRTLRT